MNRRLSLCRNTRTNDVSSSIAPLTILLTSTYNAVFNEPLSSILKRLFTLLRNSLTNLRTILISYSCIEVLTFVVHFINNMAFIISNYIIWNNIVEEVNRKNTVHRTFLVYHLKFFSFIDRRW